MRKYSPFGLFQKECSKNYEIPNSKLIVEKGMLIMVSVDSIHSDPNHFDEPDAFRPERFGEITTFAEFPFFTFSNGSGNRIAQQLVELQKKLGLIFLLRKYKFDLDDRHRGIGRELKINSKCTLKAPLHGIYLKISSR